MRGSLFTLFALALFHGCPLVLGSGCALVLLGGCATGAQLQVDLITDYVPLSEFDTVTIAVTPRGSTTTTTTRHAVATGAVFVPTAGRLAAGSVEPGTVEIEVRLERRGRTLLGRRVTLTVQNTSVVPVFLLRRCGDVTCPGAGDPRTATECDDGQCVEPECLDPATCASPSCMEASDCPPPAADCAEVACLSSRCAYVGLSSACSGGRYCDPAVGCVLSPDADAGSDAGRLDAGSIDGGLVDAGMTDGGMPDGGMPDAGPPPECMVDGDCPADSFGAFSGCSFGSVCAEGATDETRTVTEWTCGGGTCQRTDRVEARACVRETDGTSCGDTVNGMPTPCSFVSTCTEIGSQDVPVTAYRCVAGACTPNTNLIPVGCSRPSRDGVVCGGEHDACLSGTCQTMNSSTHCGAYGVSCLGNPCEAISTGGGTHWACVTIATAECIGLTDATDGPRSGGAAFMNHCHCACNTRAGTTFDSAPFDQVCDALLTGAQAGANVCGVGVCRETLSGSWNYCAMF